MFIKYFPIETKMSFFLYCGCQGKRIFTILSIVYYRIHASKAYWPENQAGMTNIIKITMHLKELQHLWLTSESCNYSLHVVLDSYQNQIWTSYELQAITEILWWVFNFFPFNKYPISQKASIILSITKISLDHFESLKSYSTFARIKCELSCFFAQHVTYWIFHWKMYFFSSKSKNFLPNFPVSWVILKVLNS